MPRKRLIRSKEYPYHVTARANNREPFHLDLQNCWAIFSNYLNEATKAYQIKVHAFVLMPNHFHLLISTPQDDLGVVMQYLMKSVTQTMNHQSGRSGRVFGAKYHWSMITTSDYYDCALKYVYRNPVEAGLSSFVESYTYSTLMQFIHSNHQSIQLQPHFAESCLIPNNDLPVFLTWLNRTFESEQKNYIKRGLMKTQFIPPKTGWMKKRFVI